MSLIKIKKKFIGRTIIQTGKGGFVFKVTDKTSQGVLEMIQKKRPEMFEGYVPKVDAKAPAKTSEK